MKARAKTPPEWVLDIEKRLRRLRISKLALARMMKMNYSIVCNSSTGYLNRPEVVEQITAKLDELESDSGA